MIEIKDLLLVALEADGDDLTSVAWMANAGSADIVSAILKECDLGVLNEQAFAEVNVSRGLFSRHARLAEKAGLQRLVDSDSQIACVILMRDCLHEDRREAYARFRTEKLFDYFNDGALRGSDADARQALLDSFAILPNRFLSADGRFLSDGMADTAAAVDKFPSLISHRAERLRRDGNRVIPGAMIRDGVHVGKRNIFMFHAAVNIAAFVGDDNLIDSHASVGSAAQIGNKNKIGSFVSLEGVLSPANAKGVEIGSGNFLGSFVRVGAGIEIGDDNFLGAGVNISLGTKIKDCRSDSASRGEYLTCGELNGSFHRLVLAPNNAVREFQGVKLLPGEYILFENKPEFMARFEGDDRIRAKG